MEYYKRRTLAFNRIKALLEQGATKEMIYLNVAENFGLGKRFVNESISIIEGVK